MDHIEAVRLQAAAKYVLGELPQDLQEAYEEHYFDCPQCALDVKAAAAFVDNSRHVFQTEPVVSAAKDSAKGWSGWFVWLRPAFAVPAMAILLGVVAYQNLVTMPGMKSGTAGRAQVFNSYPLVGGNVRAARGDEAAKIKVHKNETFALDFDFLPTRPFDHYLCQLQDETGRAVLQVSVPADKARQEVHLLVANGVDRVGKYSVVVSGDPAAKGTWDKENEVSRMEFLVEFLP